jgi:hypothetical protein
MSNLSQWAADVQDPTNPLTSLQRDDYVLPRRASPRAKIARAERAPNFALLAREKTLPEVFQFDLTKHAPCWKNLINRFA